MELNFKRKKRNAGGGERGRKKKLKFFGFQLSPVRKCSYKKSTKQCFVILKHQRVSLSMQSKKEHNSKLLMG